MPTDPQRETEVVERYRAIGKLMVTRAHETNNRVRSSLVKLAKRKERKARRILAEIHWQALLAAGSELARRPRYTEAA